MSQVKIQKLATGGTFIIDGQEIKGDDAINAIRPYLGETTGGIMDALRAGQTVDYNSANNTIRITNKNGQSLTDTYLSAGKRANVNDSNFKKDWGATFNTEPHRFKEDLLKLRGVVLGGAGGSDSSASSLLNLRKGSGWFYTKDENGNDIFEEGPLNKDRLAMLADFRKYIEDYGDLGEEASKKKYSTEGWSPDNLRALQNSFKDIKGFADREAYWTGLIDRIKNNKLDNVDKETLRLMGFDDSIPASTTAGNGSGAAGFAIDPNWKGDKDALKRRGLGVKRTKDGRWQFTGDADNQFLTNNWWTAGLDFLPEDMQKGFLLDNGTWYSENEVYNNPKFVPQVGGWYGARRDNWNNWYDDVNGSNIRFVNDRIWNNAGADNYGVFNQSFDTQNEYNPYLSPYFKQHGITGPVSVADVSNQFTNLGNGSRVFAYLDPTSAFNIQGVPTISYVYYNPNSDTKYSDNLSGLVRNLYGSTNDITTSNYISGQEIGNGRKKRRFALHGELNIPGSDNSVLADEEGNLYLGKWNQSAGNLRGHRITNMDLLNEILANPDDPKWKNINLEDLYKTVIVDSNVNAPSKKKGWDRIKENARTSLNWNYDVYRKQGGTLPKLQYGGPIKNTNTTKTQKKTEESKTDIVKPHKLDGSDGKLDSWEKMQIAAAIGDAIGVGLSFGGVAGGVAGAATGLASTGTRFAADIKKDGLDWGDVKRLGINTAFDVAALPASFIPGADNVIKAKKLARTVKSIGQPVLKWLGTIGATKGTINIAQKWINGESPTSQDLTAFISGLGAGAVAAKQWSKQLGGSKLAASRSDVAANAANANVPKEAVAGIGEGKELRYTTEGLSEIVKNAKGSEAAVVERIIKDAGDQGVTLTKETAIPVLEKLGIKPGQKGKVNFWIRKDGKWQWPGKRGEARVDYTPQQQEAGRSGLYYFTHPIARQRALGYLSGNTKQGNLLDNITAKEYNDIISKGSLRDHTISGALRRRAVENPEAFNFEFSPNVTSVRIPWQFGWHGYLRKPGKWALWEPVTTYNGGTHFERSLTDYRNVPIGHLFPTHRASDTDIIFRRNLIKGRGMRPKMGSHLPAQREIDPAFLARRKQLYARSYQLPNSSLWEYKKGGKIVKAQNGTSLVDNNFGYDFSSDAFKNWFNNGGASILTGQRQSKFPTLQPIEPIKGRAVASNVITTNTGQTYHGTESIGDAVRSKSVEYDPGNGGLPGKKFLLNKPNVDDAIRAAITARAIYHDRDLQRAALGKLYQRQFQTPQFDRLKYDYSPIEQGYNESVKPYLESRFVTSDARDSMAFKLNKAQQLSGLAGQKNTQLTQYKSQIDSANNQIDNTNEQARVQTANEKSQYLTNLNYQDAMLNSVAWNRLFSDAINPFGQQMSQQGRDAFNKELSMKYQFDSQNLQRLENSRIQGELNKQYSTKWNALTADQKKQYNNDLETYVYTVDPENYKKIVNGNDIYRGQMYNLMNRYSRGTGAGLIYAKSGGTINIKTTNKNQRPAQEQIAINSAKSAKRSVDELSKALLKMLAQLTK